MSQLKSPKAGKAEVNNCTREFFLLRCFVLVTLFLSVLLLLLYLVNLNSRVYLLEEKLQKLQLLEENDVTNKNDIEGLEQELLRHRRSATISRNKRCRKYGCHLVTSASQNTIVAHNGIFEWTRDDPLSECHMATTPIGAPVRSIKILESGLYYIYAQVTYRATRTRVAPWNGQVLFEIRMTDDHPDLFEPTTTTLLRSFSHTRAMNTTPVPESGYLGGLQRLHAGQVIFVHESTPMRRYSMQPTENYFGAFLVQRLK
uniref:uncharacterized protein LOC100180074 isoform X2 n=1 Tax=Ciona intestinalis TaxID=7719 RepID=UPI000180D108|nr:uncharacterized protein LOC100180074 isoform X2 [Ciona intestinalis]|eukprot:XP_002126171.1 uncharacterized protein LOC100180074 isoform X2 [Ciona intestinalis]